jgi:hypothetical protein
MGRVVVVVVVVVVVNVRAKTQEFGARGLILPANQPVLAAVGSSSS